MDCNFTNVIDLITDQQTYQLNLIAIKFRLDEDIWAKTRVGLNCNEQNTCSFMNKRKGASRDKPNQGG